MDHICKHAYPRELCGTCNPPAKEMPDARRSAADCSPCPFCGGSAEVAYAEGHGGLLRFEVQCIAPDCRAKGPTGKRTAAEAKESWNTTIIFRQANDQRVAPPTQDSNETPK